ncbi:acyl-CoA dehydrogenase family protein [Saccharopolyspora dendranthemae]|uniref:Acyl-CoA dehydrogenase n=1 Tax=Saccharopolyspora dendranthemae TaxID=1181886 RepID=A0A561U7J9_9PSEU|nr:acyl-CoA dehydrogenase family protein [Saccharopolyspora dendranthemae]TWF95338.1 acyl-CoA dehydrogenase [Saccharopolyspora dendranthemae]
MTSVDHELRDVLRGLLAGDLDDRLDQAAGGVGFDAELWGRLGELGFTALTTPEDHCGSGAGWREASVLLNESAAAARHLPFAETDLLARWLLRRAGLGPGDVPAPRTVAVVGEGGVARAVPWLGHVPVVVVFRRRSGTLAFAEDVRATITPVTTGSGQPRADLTLTEEPTDAVDLDESVLDQLLLRGALARAVQIAGALDRAVELCVEHAGVRTQFGRPIGKFQAVQHLVADAAAEAALARAAVDAAVLDAADDDFSGPAAATQVAAARSCAGHATSVVVRNAHQVHGAIGTTLEHPLQLFTLAALDWRGEFGTTRDWDRFLGAAATGSGLWEVVLGESSRVPALPAVHR